MQKTKLNSKQTIITTKDWVDCYICASFFGRRRETLRYCDNCSNGFCEGEHGRWPSINNKGLCIICESISIKPNS